MKKKKKKKKKKAEQWRIGAFELWGWRRPLRVPWTARRSNLSTLKEISPEYSLERLMLKLKLQYFGHLMWRSWLIGKYPGAGKDWRQQLKGTTEDEMVGLHYWLVGHEFKLQVFMVDREAWHATVYGVTKNGIRLRDWTELKTLRKYAKYTLTVLYKWKNKAWMTAHWLTTWCTEYSKSLLRVTISFKSIIAYWWFNLSAKSSDEDVQYYEICVVFITSIVVHGSKNNMKIQVLYISNVL